MKNIGFAMALVGVAGLAEGQLIALLYIAIGALLMRKKNEKSNKHSDTDSRPYFLH